jgi:hypothetical protein
MNESEFSQAANDIAVFLGASAPTATKILAWMPKVERIPSEAIGYIVEKITDESDRMPANLPKAFREKFRLWQMENPEKTAQIVQQGCPDCELGILFLEREGKTAAVFCQCYDGDTGAIGRTTLAWMQRQGWRSTKADKLGTEYGDKAAIKAQMAQARQDERRTDPERYDGYEDQFAEGW